MQDYDFPSKYYPVDVGLRNAGLNFRQVEITHLMKKSLLIKSLLLRGLEDIA